MESIRFYHSAECHASATIRENFFTYYWCRWHLYLHSSLTVGLRVCVCVCNHLKYLYRRLQVGGEYYEEFANEKNATQKHLYSRIRFTYEFRLHKFALRSIGALRWLVLLVLFCASRSQARQ